MTREKLLRYGKEYLHELETAYCCKINGLHLNFVRESIKALEQESVLDKIRAEIIAESFPEDEESSFPKLVYLKEVLDIINKYKTESEKK